MILDHLLLCYIMDPMWSFLMEHDLAILKVWHIWCCSSCLGNLCLILHLISNTIEVNMLLIFKNLTCYIQMMYIELMCLCINNVYTYGDAHGWWSWMHSKEKPILDMIGKETTIALPINFTHVTSWGPSKVLKLLHIYNLLTLISLR